MERQGRSYERLLIERIKEEDVKAFKLLFDMYYERLCRFVYLIIKDESSVEEVVQEVFINFWESRRQINITTSVKAYLYTACKNRALNLSIKKANNNLSIHMGFYDEIPAGQTPEEIFAYQQLDNDFHGAIESLPGQAKRVFKLKHFERAKQKEIASLMNISESTVEKHMGYALRHLRKSLSVHRVNL